MSVICRINSGLSQRSFTQHLFLEYLRCARYMLLNRITLGNKMVKVPALKDQSGGGENQRENDKYVQIMISARKEIHQVLKRV